MKRLEDRIKDRLEGYESRLPEGDLAEFKAMLDATAKTAAKRGPARLAWLVPAAVAAGLALLFALRQGPQPDAIQVMDNPQLVADVVEGGSEGVEASSEVVEAVEVSAGRRLKPASPAAAPGAAPEQGQRDGAESAASGQVVAAEPASAGSPEQRQAETGEPVAERDQAQIAEPEQRQGEGPTAVSKAFAPSAIAGNKPVSAKVGAATASVLGGAGAVALAGALPSFLMRSDMEAAPPYDIPSGIEGNYNDPARPLDAKTRRDTHHMPLRAGLSLRTTLSDRWALTTGLGYSWYDSEIDYSLSGVHKQNVYYLDIPLRADFTLARNRWMDVYVGAGGELDFCVAAYDAGQKAARDGAALSLIGVGGIQFNINKYLGLFFDPSFSWDITSERRVLDTYRSEHPFMLTVSTGLRLTLPSSHR